MLALGILQTWEQPDKTIQVTGIQVAANDSMIAGLCLSPSLLLGLCPTRSSLKQLSYHCSFREGCVCVCGVTWLLSDWVSFSLDHCSKVVQVGTLEARVLPTIET